MPMMLEANEVARLPKKESRARNLQPGVFKDVRVRLVVIGKAHPQR